MIRLSFTPITPSRGSVGIASVKCLALREESVGHDLGTLSPRHIITRPEVRLA